MNVKTVDARPDLNLPSPRQVLRLRLLDWMWPSAVAGAFLIAYLGHTTGTYRIGSVTYYANTYGPPLFLILLGFAGVRWCSIGRSETSAATLGKRRFSLARLMLDLPGILLAGWVVWIVAWIVLGLFGIVDLD